MAPDEELKDPSKAIILKGRVFDRKCEPMSNVIVDVWHAGLPNTNYTFPPEKLWYRGRTFTTEVTFTNLVVFFIYLKYMVYAFLTVCNKNH